MNLTQHYHVWFGAEEEIASAKERVSRLELYRARLLAIPARPQTLAEADAEVVEAERLLEVVTALAPEIDAAEKLTPFRERKARQQMLTALVIRYITGQIDLPKSKSVARKTDPARVARKVARAEHDRMLAAKVAVLQEIAG